MRHTPHTRSAARRAALLSTAAIAAITLTACSGPSSTGPSSGARGEPQYGGTLTIATTATPAIIDPYATTLQADWVIARQVCEPLFDVSTTYQVGPVLADAFTDEGGGVYTVTLRSGVSFQDGQPLTAADVVASLNRYLLTPGNGTLLAGMTESIEATDATTVTFRLKAPTPLLQTLLTTAYIMPASIVKDRPLTDPVTDLVCTGPYKLSSYAADGNVVLDRWDGFTKRSEPGDGGLGAKNAYADEIVFTPIPEASTRLQATQSGQVDLGGQMSFDDYATISSDSRAQAILTSPSLAPTVVFNKAQGVMSNVAMRQAFLAALNIDDVMLAAFGDPQFYTVDGSIIPAVNSVWSTDAGTGAFNHQDLSKVKDLLAQAGYHGEPIVWLTTKDDLSWYGPSVPAQQQLKEAGINIDLRVLDRASVISARTDPAKFDIFSSAIPTYADPVLLPYLQQTFPGTWTSPARDALLSQLATQTDPSARTKTWADMQTLIWQELPFMKFGTTSVLMVASARTVIERPDELTGQYYNVWLDSSK